MTLEKIETVDIVEPSENGVVQVRTATVIKENGIEIRKTYHRKTIVPGDDYSLEDVSVKAVCSALHTAGVVAAYKAAQIDPQP
jgi:hypothetical protein